MVFLKFLNFFAIFFEFSISRRVGTKRNDTFYILFLGIFKPILAWNEAIVVFLNFLNFLTIFLEFSITRWERNGMEWQFLFSLFLCVLQPILAWNGAKMVFFNFLNVFAIFLEFFISRRVETKRNDTFYILSFSALPTYFGLKWGHNGIF